MKILVAEDNDSSRYLLEQALGAAGHAVTATPDGEAALKALRSGLRPDLIISDALMPVIDGFRLCKLIRNDPELCRIPFLLYTATFTDVSDEQFALSIGVDRFVVKPLAPDRLLAVIAELVAHVRAAPPRTPGSSDDGALLDQYSRTLFIKLDQKVIELKESNARLESSQTAVHELNDRLNATVKQLEMEVAQRVRTEEFLMLAQQVGGIGSWHADPSTGSIRWTQEACRLMHLSAGQPASLDSFLAGIEPGVHAAVRALFSPVQAGDTAGADELEFSYSLPGGGKPRRFNLRSRFVRIPSFERAVLIGTLQDVSARHEAAEQRKSLEQQLFRSQKMQALGNLAGGIAHDFNNILTAILGHAEILKMELAAEQEHPDWYQSAVEIANAAERSRDTIQQILTFSRRQSAERKPVRLGQIAEEGIRLLRSTLDKRIHLSVDLASDRCVLANESQIHQVILNLCTNGAYAMREKGGTLSITLESVDTQPGPHVRLRVADSGVGIDPSIMDQIFDPFFTTKPMGEGTGLGLSVVHGIVRSHGGSISVESLPGRGTTFTLFFPSVLGTGGPREARASGSSRPPLPTGSDRRILVVDDEPSVARICAQFLGRLGFQATTLTDVNEARELFLSKPDAFDAIVTDYLMPGMTGIDFARAVKEIRPGIPILMVAGYGGQFESARAAAEGIQEVLAKPFSLTALSDALDRTFR